MILDGVGTVSGSLVGGSLSIMDVLGCNPGKEATVHADLRDLSNEHGAGQSFAGIRWGYHDFMASHDPADSLSIISWVG